MKTLAKSALGAAVAAAVASTSVQAAEVVTMDPSLTFTYKNFYWKEDAKDDNGYDRKELVHGLIADFDTGYVNDMIGAVVTAGYAGPLSVKDGDDYSVTSLATDSDGDATSISGFQQAYLKAKTTFSGVDFAGSLGVKKRASETYADSGSRVLGASSTGFDLSAGFGGADLYYSEITGFSDRNDSSFSNDLTASYDHDDDSDTDDLALKVDKIQIFGANYSYEDLSLAVEYGKSKDVVEQTFVKAGYSFDLDDSSSVDLDARYGQTEEDGNIGETVFGENYKSKYYNLNATYNFGNAYVGLGYNSTKDGDFDSNYVDGNNDKFNSSAALWEDYALEDEKAYVVSTGYNFADHGLEGLSWDLWYAKGKDAKDVADFKRREYGSSLSYAFDGSLEGLSLAWLHVNYRAEGSAEGARTDLPGTIYDENVNRFYLTYAVSVF